ncbi:MAG: trigger factor, partial [Flavobacteriales bacterium]|nr:trigger factor [Flavobacteriales bacterium]
QIDDLNALIRIKIEEPDYIEVVDKAIKNLKNKVSVPGFRPGMVPVGMIKKMYGKAVLSDEVSKLTVDHLYRYLSEQKIDFLGNPLPNTSKSQVDWDDQKEFEFYYDLGLVPDFEVVLPSDATFKHYKINMDEEMLEKQIKSLQSRYGRSVQAEVAEEKDMVMGEMTELNEDLTVKEGGLQKQVYLIMEKIVHPETRQSLIGKKSGEEIIINPHLAFPDDMTLAVYMGVKQEEAPSLSSHFRFAIQSISHMQPAEMNQEFYDRVLGIGAAEDEASFRSKLSALITEDMQQESDARLMNEIRTNILATTKFALPDEFLKRWILVRNGEKGHFNPDNIDAEYETGRESIRWELIRDKYAAQHKLIVEKDEMQNESRRHVRQRVAQMGYSLPDDKINELAEKTLEKEEEFDKIAKFLLEFKVLGAIRNECKVNEESISYDDFMKLNTPTQP